MLTVVVMPGIETDFGRRWASISVVTVRPVDVLVVIRLVAFSNRVVLVLPLTVDVSVKVPDVELVVGVELDGARVLDRRALAARAA